MPKTEKVENLDQKNDKTPKKINKSSYSKKKKTKKNILNGIAYVQSTFNNTIITIADTNGNVISWASAGQKGFKGSRKSTPYAAQIAADAAASKALEFGMKTLHVEVKGPGSGRETALRALQARGFKIISIKDTTAGFKGYRIDVLKKIKLDNIKFKGYAFQICMKYAAVKHGFKIKEVPITFVDRVEGVSKMSTGIFKEAFFGVWKMRKMKL